MHIPTAVRAHVIGRAGQTLKKIQTQCKVYTEFLQDDLIEIRGASLEAIQNAEIVVQGIIKDQNERAVLSAAQSNIDSKQELETKSNNSISTVKSTDCRIIPGYTPTRCGREVKIDSPVIISAVVSKFSITTLPKTNEWTAVTRKPKNTIGLDNIEKVSETGSNLESPNKKKKKKKKKSKSHESDVKDGIVVAAVEVAQIIDKIIVDQSTLKNRIASTVSIDMSVNGNTDDEWQIVSKSKSNNVIVDEPLVVKKKKNKKKKPVEE